MATDFKRFIGYVALLALILFAIHTYVLMQFSDVELTIKLWMIYLFNFAMVILVYGIIRKEAEKGNQKVAFWFFGLTILKMLLALVFLSPLFFGKSDQVQLEVINFFIPYFIFLTAEIIGLNKFLLKL